MAAVIRNASYHYECRRLKCTIQIAHFLRLISLSASPSEPYLMVYNYTLLHLYIYFLHLPIYNGLLNDQTPSAGYAYF